VGHEWMALESHLPSTSGAVLGEDAAFSLLNKSKAAPTQ